MDNFIDKINKLSLPTTILIASIILGGFYYASQVNKQRSIEEQQQIKIEQDNKEYVAKRRKDCYDYEASERKKFNNIGGSFYDEENDVCRVEYRNSKYDEFTCNIYERLEEENTTGLDLSALITECNKFFTKEY